MTAVVEQSTTVDSSKMGENEIYEIKQLSRVKQVKWKTLKRTKLVKQNEYIYEFVTNRN